MLTTQRVVPVLKVLLALMFVITVVFQVVSMPGQFSHMAEENPDLDYLRWPLTIWAILELLCVQVVIVGTWRLLTMVSVDRIFSEDAFKWVDAILAAMGAGWVLLGALSLFAVIKADDPGDAMALFALDLGATLVVFLMVVMRALLRQATMLRSDLEGVI